MGNKIDGGQSGFDYLSDAAAEFFGLGDADTCAVKPAAKAEKSTPEEAVEKTAAEALEELPDAPEGFLDVLSGAVSKAGAEIAGSVEKAGGEIVDSLTDAATEVVQAGAKSALQTVAQARQGVQDVADTAADITRSVGAKMLSAASDALNEIAPAPEDLSPKAREIFVQAEQTRVEFAQAIDRVIEDHPPELLAQAADDVLAGRWDLAGDLMLTIAEGSFEAGDVLLHGAGDVYLAVDEWRSAEKTALLKEVLRAGARFAVDHGEALKTAGAYVEQVADNPVVNTLVSISDFPMAGVLKSTHSIALKFANVAQSAGVVGQQLLDDEEALALLTREFGFSECVVELEKLPVGDRFRARSAVEVSAHVGAGGALGGAVGVEATRVGEQSFQVAIEVEALLAAGVGEEVMKEIGGSLDLTATPGAQVTLQFDGELAADNAARVMAAVMTSSVASLIRLREVHGARVVDAAVTPMSGGAEASFMGLKSYSGTSGSARFKEIDQTKYVGVSVASRPISLGFDKTVGQVSDTLAEGWLTDPATGNSALDALLGELPPNLVTDIKQIQGPLGGVRFGGTSEISSAMFRATDGSGVMRAEFEVKVDIALGRSTLKCSNQLVIPDLGKLADALSMNADLLHEKLSAGELSVQELVQSGRDIVDLVEYSGIKVVGEKASLNAISMLGVGSESGSIHSVVLVDGSEDIDSGARLRELVDYMPGKAARKSAPSVLSSQAQNDLLLAHAGRI